MSKFNIVTRVDDNLIKEMIELDKLVFNGDDIGAFNKCKEWVGINPDIYTVLMADNKVIGYINFMPITDTAYNKIKQGELKDYELGKDDIVAYSNNKPLKCLFTSIVIKPEHQDTQAIIELWNGFINKLKTMKINISSIVIDCVSEMGEKFIKQHLNVKFITYSHNGKIFEGNIKEIEC